MTINTHFSHFSAFFGQNGWKNALIYSFHVKRCIFNEIILFEQKQVRRVWGESNQKWYFPIVDVLAVLTESIDPGAYWRKFKERLKAEGNETVTICHSLKMKATDGKMRQTAVADAEQLLRLIQSVPSPKAEPFKRWLAKVGYERLEEIENPELATKRMRETYKQKAFGAIDF